MSINSQKYLVFIGKQITHTRNSVGITQYRLAKNLMMEQSNLARIEKGLTNPTVKTLLKISDALEIQLVNLFD